MTIGIPKSQSKPRITILGATGYVGTRLITQLLDHGYHVHCLARSPQKLATREFANSACFTVEQCNLQDAADLCTKLKGQDIVFSGMLGGIIRESRRLAGVLPEGQVDV